MVTLAAMGAGAQAWAQGGCDPNLAVGGTASASSTYFANTPEGAFDGDSVVSGWGNDATLPAWLEYDFGSGNARVVDHYELIANGSQAGGWGSESYNPKTWTFEGSNDGISWTVLDTVADGLLTKNVAKEFSFVNATSYQAYRIHITAAESGVYTHITELRLLGPGAGMDSDGDGVEDPCDVCPGFDDFVDGDGDGFPDGCDSCPAIPNPNQSSGAATLIHQYELDNSYADSLGGPSLIPAGGTLTATGYQFGANQGLSVTAGFADPSDYSIEVVFRFANTLSYRKIIDFNDRGLDSGQYSLSDKIAFSKPGSDPIGPSSTISPNTNVHLVITRDGDTERYVAYADGVEQFSFVDDDALGYPVAIFRDFDGPLGHFTNQYNVIHFFKDDFASNEAEASSGVVELIRIYDGVLSVCEVQDLFNGAPPNDTDPPVVAITSPTDGAVVGAASLAVDALVTDDSATQITSTPAGVNASLPAGGGTASGTVTLPTEGPNTVAVNAEDASGNTGGDAVTVVLDTLDPVITIVSPVDGSVFGASPVSVSVDVADATQTSVSIAGALSTIPAGGGSSVNAGVVLVEGPNTVSVSATDAAGNGAAESVTVVLDLTAPIVAIDTPVDGACFGPGEETIGVTATIDDLTATTVGSTPAGVSGTLPAGGGVAVGTVTLSEGSNAITVSATDAANSVGSDSIVVVLDTTAPAVSITSPADGDAVAGSIDFDVDPIDPLPGSGVAQVEFAVDGNPVASLTASPWGIVYDTAPLADGLHTLSVTAADGRGNESTQSVAVLVDNTAPAVAFSAPTDGALVSGSLVLDVNASDGGSGIVEIEVLANGAAPTADPSATYPTPVGSTNVFGSEDTTLQLDGSLTLSARAKDDAGNEALVSVAVTVDNTAPDKTLISPADGEIVTGVITIEAASSDPGLDSITILVEGTPLATSSTSPLSVDYDTTGVLDGSLSIEVRVVDLAGNQSSCTATVLVDNVTARMKPKKLNLKADKGKGAVKAELAGANLEQFLPTEDHIIELRVPGGSPVPANQGWGGDDAVEDGVLNIAFDRAALVNSILAGIAAGAIQPNSNVSLELFVDGSLVDAIVLSVKGP